MKKTAHMLYPAITPDKQWTIPVCEDRWKKDILKVLFVLRGKKSKERKGKIEEATTLMCLTSVLMKW